MVKIGIIVHSNSGHTLAVAQELRDRLASDGLDVALHQLETVGTASPGSASVTLENRPSLDGYDKLVFGSPVNGGRMSSAIAAYLDGVSSLEGQPVVFLLTHFLRRSWGTEQTIAQMRELCESRGATVIESADVRWPNLRRKRDIRRAVDRLSQLLMSDEAATQA